MARGGKEIPICEASPSQGPLPPVRQTAVDAPDLVEGVGFCGPSQVRHIGGAPHWLRRPAFGFSPALPHWLLPRPPAGSATVAEPADRAPLPQHQRLEQRQPPQGTQTPLFLADQLSRSPGRRSSCGNCRSKARFAETAKIGRRRSRPRIRGHGSSKDLCNNCDVGAATEHRDKARHRSGAQAKAQARLQSQPKPKPKLRQKPTLRHDPTPKR